MLSATAVFAACILLGFLAKRISGNVFIGVLVAIIGLVTPWLFETSRLAFGAALYPLVIVGLLWALYRVREKQIWAILDITLIAITLSLVTYTYSIGRLLGPLLALGLVVYARNIGHLKNILKAWTAYALTLIPLVVFHVQNPGALAGRFTMTVGIGGANKSFQDIFSQFFANFIANISPHRLLVTGDPNLRHHITDTPAFFLAPLAFAAAGIVLVLVKHRRDAWWRYVIFGVIASLIPASLTVDQFHSLRLIAVPVFLLVLMIPPLKWFLSLESGEGRLHQLATSGRRRIVLASLLFMTLVQAIFFQSSYREIGPKRGLWFDDAYPKILDAALSDPSRPIYLIDGAWGQAYLHAYWWALTKKVDLSAFVRVQAGQRPPADALVLSSEDKCTNCRMILKEGTYLLYREGSGSGSDPANPTVQAGNVSVDASAFTGGSGTEPGRFHFPHGLALDAEQNIYIADTGNGRIQKFSPTGRFLISFCQGICIAPKAVAVEKGFIYIVDDVANKLLRLKAVDLTPASEWEIPEPPLKGPADISADGAGNVYIADQGNARILKFSSDGKLLSTWGNVGEGDGQFRQLTGISARGNRVFAADARNARVQVFDQDGKFLSLFSIPEWVVPEGAWQSPDVSFDDKTGRLYVSSTNSHKVFVFDEKGSKLGDVAFAELSGPTALALAQNGKLYVLNTLSGKVSSTTPQTK
ncbi:MAG TPA: NHL repeat-containing protein [Pyrinomonadaceae bacterium]|nr:NHL repeat-containing protein [Pyrinomonadaceae bacterium]